ncbi:hypothetical protein KHA93_15380 [Bacillus sp. FJAT-49732]|uniref:Uncharacterized protein n=1 Tax=Lederbergia citrisecunda TaxID=2833583 RepID=A0A942YM26_9BACI|nr:hypothetical protein [Lederbergia citrisecunda]MBS4201019.1 hypothetical protein [Lederbergia citrisecunda]
MKTLKPLNVTYLISNWISISMIFLIGEAVIRFGVFAGIVIVCTFLLAFCAALPFLKPIFSNSPPVRIQKWLKGLLLAIWFLEIFILHFVISGLLLQAFFDLHYTVSIFFTVAITFGVIIFLSKIRMLIFALKNTKFILISSLAIFLPTYIYLQKGLESVYHDLLHYHPSILHNDQKDLWLLIAIAFLIFFTKFLLQGELLAKYAGTTFNKGIRKLFVAVFIYSTFILAFSTMMVVAITQNLEVNHVNELLLYMIRKLSTPNVSHLIGIVLYICTLLTLVLSFFLFEDELDHRRLLRIPQTLILIAAGCAIVFYHQELTLLNIYSFSGILISGFILLFLFFRMSKNIKKMK